LPRTTSVFLGKAVAAQTAIAATQKGRLKLSIISDHSSGALLANFICT
jgi:hypothetical protein